MKADQFDLDYVKAAIETLDLIELFLIRLNIKHRINEFTSIFQELIERSKLGSKSDENTTIPSSNSVKDVRSAAKYWEGASDTLIFLKNQWEELNDYEPFFTVLRERRDSLLMHIIIDAISPLNEIINKFFLIHSDDYRLPEVLRAEDLDEKWDEEDSLSPALREALQILREEAD